MWKLDKSDFTKNCATEALNKMKAHPISDRTKVIQNDSNVLYAVSIKKVGAYGNKTAQFNINMYQQEKLNMHCLTFSVEPLLQSKVTGLHLSLCQRLSCGSAEGWAALHPPPDGGSSGITSLGMDTEGQKILFYFETSSVCLWPFLKYMLPFLSSLS